jgi:hypothetical protein
MISIICFISLITFCFSLQCDTKQTDFGTKLDFCANSFGITATSFNADPEVRTFRGHTYMTFTAAVVINSKLTSYVNVQQTNIIFF